MNQPIPVTSSTATTQFTSPVETLRDFTTTWRVLPITGLALIIGVVSAYVAVALLKLINPAAARSALVALAQPKRRQANATPAAEPMTVQETGTKET